MKAFYLTLKVFTMLLLGLVLLGIQPIVFAAETTNPDKTNIHFQWTFGAIRKMEQGSKFETIADDTVLETGDRIKFFIRVKNGCFIYLIYHSSQDELSILFPYRFKPLSKEFSASEHHYVPKGNQWFKLDDHVGRETFYLLASAKRLYDLEKLINNYESADKTRKSDHTKKILAEIQKLIEPHVKLKTSAERPVGIIGNLRVAEEREIVKGHELANYAVEISAKDFYSRAFIIDHK